MKKHFARVLALLLAASMLTGLLAGCGRDSAETTGGTDTAAVETAGGALEYPVTPEELGSGTVKWSEETTKDGWIKVTNEGGETLGYSPDSGVNLIQVDGYAFKDLNRNGKLDIYEDWRLDDNTRAEDLAAQLPIETIANLMSIPSTFSVESDGSDATVTTEAGENVKMSEAIQEGLRCILTYCSALPALSQARWNNNTQAMTEKADAYGIPFLISTDGRSEYMAGMRNTALAATFDTEAVNTAAQLASEKYRALGLTEVLEPQIDIASEPRWQRTFSTFSEDPALTRDMANAYISGMQSTYTEDGTDLGWGEDSVINVMKHWPGDGTAEGGRDSHLKTGKYTVYPTDSFETGLISFVDGGLNLDSLTEMAGGVMTSYSVAYSEDESYGELVGSAFSEYKVQLLRSYGYDNVIMTDAGVTSGVADNSVDHGVEGMSMAEKDYLVIKAGVDQILGGDSWGEYLCILEAYDRLAEEMGEEEATERFRDSARRILRDEFRIGLFENAYVDSENAVNVLDKNAEADEIMAEISKKSVVMVKNSDNIIQAASDDSDTKPTVYIPMQFSEAAPSPMGIIPASWSFPIDEKTADKYFNYVTDTVTEPSGVDADGNPCYTENDIIRASAEELAECDYALVFISSPSTGSGYNPMTGSYLPISLQYGEYTARSEGVRSVSIAGDIIESEAETPYGNVVTQTQENRSYYGKSTVASNIGDLELVLETANLMPEGAGIIVCVNSNGSMIFSEFEEQVDAILVGFGVSNDTFLDIVTGKVEPSGLLPFQMPANMETVEAQMEDVPRDMECYVDSNGNTYDFAFGLNWSGVISDERTAKYAVEPLTTPEHQPVN